MSAAQKRALIELEERYLVPCEDGALDLDALFRRKAPRTVEIGFGAGDALLALAKRHPERDFLGIEVYPPGVGQLLARANACGIDNLKVAMADALEVLSCSLPRSSVDEALVWFPDPWPKKRHHKRRLVGREFAELVHRALRPGGVLRLATDWEPYAEHILQTLTKHPGFSNCAGAEGFMPRSPLRLETRFERRGQKEGYRIFDLAFRSQPMNAPLFIYGSIRDEDVRALVLGDAVRGISIEEAWMPDAALARVPGECYPYLSPLSPRSGQRVRGDLIHGLDQRTIERIVYFEGDEYVLSECIVEDKDGKPVQAMYFEAVSIADGPFDPWSFDGWQAHDKMRFMRICRAYMELWHQGKSVAQAEALWRDIRNDI
ncbi:MAG: tRNA (guanosine(46)-N7)-methyltransferase TrmB [Ectothiorhodospiraceae bacterium AqS1]|nr:tRNA (guanosine(46)-N7)-methyltransferase TrmB [Ectothiorhodospiraceae bacterium AqS1]